MSSGRSGNPRGVRELQGRSGNYKVGPEATRLHRQTRELWSDVLLTETQVRMGSAVLGTAAIYTVDADVNETTLLRLSSEWLLSRLSTKIVFPSDTETVRSQPCVNRSG